jgi:hypothetical protein
MPQLGAGSHFTTGGVFFVDSGATNASDSNLGTSPDKSLATLNGAMDKCTANNGDMVFLMPGHGENLDAATDAVIDVAGVRVIGIGVGTTRPTFTYTGTAGAFEIDAANSYVENVRFLASVSAVVVAVNVDAADVTLANCEWNFDATGDDFLLFLDIDAVDRCQVLGCTMIAQDAAGADQAIRLDDTDNTKIIGNAIFGDFAVNMIGSTSDAAVCNGLVIADNILVNRDPTNAANGIDFDVAHTGVIANNRLAGLSAADVTTLLDPGSCFCLENYAVNAIDESGILLPATLST